MTRVSDISEALFYQLTHTAGVTALVSTRVYPDLMPQNPTMPAVVYQMIDNVREERHRGQTGDARPKFQLTCWGTTALSAAAVAVQVRLAIMAMSGSVNSVTIKGVWNANETRGYEPDTQLHYVAIDFVVAHLEAVA